MVLEADDEDDYTTLMNGYESVMQFLWSDFTSSRQREAEEMADWFIRCRNLYRQCGGRPEYTLPVNRHFYRHSTDRVAASNFLFDDSNPDTAETTGEDEEVSNNGQGGDREL